MAMSQAHKDAIRRGQLRRHRATRETLPRLEEFRKKCTRCRVWKVVKVDGSGDFRMKQRVIVSGVTAYPASECKTCANRRAEAWRERKRAEGVLLEMQRAWAARRDDERRRAYQREYGRMQRVLEGCKPRGPWKRYRINERELRVTTGSFFPLWMRAHQLAEAAGASALGRMGKGGSVHESRLADWFGLSEVEYTTLRRIFNGWTQGDPQRETVAMDLADRVLIAAGMEHRRRELEVVFGQRKGETPAITGMGETPLKAITIDEYKAARKAQRDRKRADKAKKAAA